MGEVAKRFFGAWRYLGDDGRRQAACRDAAPIPRGSSTTTRAATWRVQVAPDRERTKAGSAPTPEEAQAALADYIAYFGTYTIDERARTVTHHRQGSVQPGDVADLVRGYEFAGDRLILRPPGTTHEVVWERIK